MQRKYMSAFTFDWPQTYVGKPLVCLGQCTVNSCGSHGVTTCVSCYQHHGSLFYIKNPVFFLSFITRKLKLAIFSGVALLVCHSPSHTVGYTEGGRLCTLINIRWMFRSTHNTNTPVLHLCLKLCHVFYTGAEHTGMEHTGSGIFRQKDPKSSPCSQCQATMCRCGFLRAMYRATCK